MWIFCGDKFRISRFDGIFRSIGVTGSHLIDRGEISRPLRRELCHFSIKLFRRALPTETVSVSPSMFGKDGMQVALLFSHGVVGSFCKVALHRRG